MTVLTAVTYPKWRVRKYRMPDTRISEWSIWRDGTFVAAHPQWTWREAFDAVEHYQKQWEERP